MRNTIILSMILAGILAIAACGGDDDTATPVPATATSVAATATPAPTATQPPPAKAQGMLTVSEDMGRESWGVRFSTQEHPLLSMGEPLLWWDGSRNDIIGGAILTSWDGSTNSDGSIEWIFKIREGVEFQKGWGEVTAEDVKNTFLNFAIEEPPSTNAYTIYQVGWWGNDPNNLTVVDDYTLKIRMPEVEFAQWRMFYVLGPVEGRLFKPFPKAYMDEVGEDEFALNPVFAGPFEFESQEIGSSLTLRAVEDHYRQPPAFEILRYLKVGEESTRVAMLQTGQLDIVRVAPLSGEQLERAGIDIVVNEFSTGVGVYLGGLFPEHENYDPAVPWAGPDPLAPDRIKIRKAMHMAVDQDAIVDKLALGYGAVGAYHTIFAPNTNASWWSSSWTPRTTYDPEGARELMAEAGYPDCFSFNIYLVSQFALSPEIGEAVASQWEQNLGCDITRRTGEYLPLRSMLLDRDTDGWAYAMGAGGGRIAPPYDFGCLHGGPQYQVITHTEFPKVTEICTDLEKSVDPADWDRLNKEFGQFDYDSYMAGPVIALHSIYGVGPSVDPDSFRPWPGRNQITNLEFVRHSS